MELQHLTMRTTEGDLSGDQRVLYHHCDLFQFVMDVALTGFLCLVGFAGNTLCFTVLWRQKHCTASMFLLQAILIADMVIIWMLFIEQSIPALAYVVPLLQNCSSVCQYLHRVTQPLLLLAEACLMWFTLQTVIVRYVVMCQPGYASRLCSVDWVRKQAIVTVIIGVIYFLPMTCHHVIKIRHIETNSTSVDVALADNWWYQLVYLHIATYLLVYLIPILLLLYFAGRLLMVLHNVKRLRQVLATAYKAQSTDLTQILLVLAIMLFLCYLPTLVLKCLAGIQVVALTSTEKTYNSNPALHEQTKQQEMWNGSCGDLHYYLAAFSRMFQALNSSLKVFIFCLFAKRFREVICNAICRPAKASDANIFGGLYKCADMSEMTLISNIDNRLQS